MLSIGMGSSSMDDILVNPCYSRRETNSTIKQSTHRKILRYVQEYTEQLLNKAKYHMKNYGDLGGCYLPKPCH